MGSGRLANLLIIGVPKAGTTSLFTYLAQHPEICGSDEKEIGYFNYFNSLYNTGRQPPPVESYAAHFARCSSQQYALEATPSYFYGGQAVIDGIRELITKPKVIVTLRNPTDRLWSAYTFQRSMGKLQRITSFEEYISVCEQRRREGIDLGPTSPHLQGLAVGFYADYLSTWLDSFGADMKVIFAEDMAREPERVLKTLFGWLEIDPDCVSTLDLEARAVTVSPRSQRIASFAYSLNRASNRFQIFPSAARERLRHAYLWMNTDQTREHLDSAVRHRVDTIYRPSNLATVKTLSAHGYEELPTAWMRSIRGRPE